MNKKITFRHMEHSNVMEDYINQQLGKVENFLMNERTPIYIDIIINEGKIHAHHKVEMRVKTPHYDAFTHYEGPKIYDVIDEVIDRMYEKLKEEKKKFAETQKTIDKY
ncbi:HPF/RaiA family ribosome-associated protein [Candidatus Dependentiae bacterium]|nr:HPF/RaiA family ribosome-associated protein [Candidatus Dependentiae bacterium]